MRGPKPKYQPTRSSMKQFIRDRCTEDANGCWIWHGPISYNPCKRAKIGRSAQLLYGFVSNQASRSAYWLWHSEKWDPDLLVLHNKKCNADNSCICVNPNHMYQGTLLDNARDRSAFGNAPFGELNWKAYWTEKQVKQIREMYRQGETIVDIGKVMGLKFGSWSKNRKKYDKAYGLVRSALINWNRKRK